MNSVREHHVPRASHNLGRSVERDLATNARSRVSTAPPALPLAVGLGVAPGRAGRHRTRGSGTEAGTPLPGVNVRLLNRQPSGVLTSTSRYSPPL